MELMMRTTVVFILSVTSVVVAISSTAPHAVAAQNAGGTGTITGHVKLTGPSPGNPIIRMGMDPMCAKLNAGKRPINEFVVTSENGGLANAFVDLQGTFPNAGPAPSAPVVLTQKNCIYTPRVVGARVGGTLRIGTDDNLTHNVHGQSTKNTFNFSEVKAGMTRDIKLQGPDVLMHVMCDIHSWMAAYIGVEAHPYYGVSGMDGAFTISNVPPGRQTIRVWHERFGQLTQTVTVAAGKTATIDFSYTGKEKPAKARLQDLTVPLDASTMTLEFRAGV